MNIKKNKPNNYRQNEQQSIQQHTQIYELNAQSCLRINKHQEQKTMLNHTTSVIIKNQIYIVTTQKLQSLVKKLQNKMHDSSVKNIAIKIMKLVQQISSIKFAKQWYTLVIISKQEITANVNLILNPKIQQLNCLIVVCSKQRDTLEIEQMCKDVHNILVTSNWEKIEQKIQNAAQYIETQTKIFTEVISKRFLQKQYKSNFLNVFYCPEYEQADNIVKSNNSNNLFKKVNYFKWSNIEQINTYLNIQKSNELEQNEIMSTNLILTDIKNYAKASSFSRDKQNFKIINLYSKQQKIQYIEQLDEFQDNQRLLSIQEIISCTRIYLYVNQNDKKLLGVIREINLEQKFILKTYRHLANLDTNIEEKGFGIVIVNNQEEFEIKKIIFKRRIRNFKFIVKQTKNYPFQFCIEALILRSKNQSEIVDCLKYLSTLRQIYFYPLSAMVFQNIKILIKQKNQNIYDKIATVLVNKKRLNLNEYENQKEITNIISNKSQEQFILIICDNISFRNLLKIIKDKKNVFLVIIGKFNSVTYHPQILEICQNQQALITLISSIPELEEEKKLTENTSEIKYISNQYSHQIQSKLSLIKKQDLQSFIFPFPGRPIIYIHLPLILSTSIETRKFQQKLMNQYKQQISFVFYDKVDQLKSIQINQQPMAFYISIQSDKDWFIKFISNNTHGNLMVILLLNNEQNLDSLTKMGKFSLVSDNFMNIQMFIRFHYENYMNLLIKEKIPKRYSDFSIKEKQNLHFYYDTRDSKAKLILQNYKTQGITKIVQQIVFHPYENTDILKKQIDQMDQNSQIIILANEFRKTGTEKIVLNIIKNRNYLTKVITQAEANHPAVPRTQFYSTELKKCVDWIAGIPILAIHKQKLIKNASEKQIQNKQQSIVLIIDYNNINLDYCREVFFQNRNSYQLEQYESESKLLQILMNLKNNKKELVVLLIEKEEQSYYFNTLGNYNIRYIIENNKLHDKISKENILCQSNRKNIIQYIYNFKRNTFQLSTQLIYKKQLKILINTDMLSTQVVNSIFKFNIEHKLSLDRYNSKQELTQYLSGIFGKYDFIVCCPHDYINPNSSKLILFDRNPKSDQEKLTYEFVTQSEQMIFKIFKKLYVLKKYDLKELHKYFQQRNPKKIKVFVPLKCELDPDIFKNNFTLKNIQYKSQLAVDFEAGSLLIVKQSSKFKIKFGSSEFYSINDQEQLSDILKSIPNFIYQYLISMKNHKINIFLNKNSSNNQIEVIMRETAVRNPTIRVIFYVNINQLKENVIRVRTNQQYFIIINKDEQRINELLTQYKQRLVIFGENNLKNVITLYSTNDLKRFIYAIPHNLQPLPFKRKSNSRYFLLYPASLKPTPLFNKILEIQNKILNDLNFQQYKNTGQLIGLIQSVNQKIVVVVRQSELDEISTGINKSQLKNNIKLLVLSQHKNLVNYKYNRVQLVTNEFQDIYEFCNDLTVKYEIKIELNNFLIVPDYYKNLIHTKNILKGLKQTTANIINKKFKFYDNEDQIAELIVEIEDSENIFLVINKPITNLKFKDKRSVNILFEGSSRKKPPESKIQAVSPYQLFEKIKFEKQGQLNILIHKDYFEILRKKITSEYKITLFSEKNFIKQYLKQNDLNLIIIPKIYFNKELLFSHHNYDRYQIKFIIFGTQSSEEFLLNQKILLISDNKEKVIQFINNLKRTNISYYPAQIKSSKILKIYYEQSMIEIKTILSKIRNKNIECIQFINFRNIQYPLQNTSQSTILITQQMKNLQNKNVYQILYKKEGVFFTELYNKNILFISKNQYQILKYLSYNLKQKYTQVLIQQKMLPQTKKQIRQFAQNIGKISRIVQFQNIVQLRILSNENLDQQTIVISSDKVQKGNYKLLLYNAQNYKAQILFNQFIILYFFDQITDQQNKITIFYEGGNNDLHEHLISINQKCKRKGIIKLVMFTTILDLKNKLYEPKSQEQTLIVVHKKQSIEKLNSIHTAARKLLLSNFAYGDFETITYEALKEELTKHLNLSEIIENTVVTPFFSQVKFPSEMDNSEKITVLDTSLNASKEIENYCTSNNPFFYEKYTDNQKVLQYVKQSSLSNDTIIIIITENQSQLLKKIYFQTNSNIKLALITANQGEISNKQLQIKNEYKKNLIYIKKEKKGLIQYLEKLKQTYKRKKVNPSNLDLMSKIDEEEQLIKNQYQDYLNGDSNFSLINEELFETFDKNFLNHPSLIYYIQQDISQTPDRESVEYFKSVFEIRPNTDHKIIIKRSKQSINFNIFINTRVITIIKQKMKASSAQNSRYEIRIQQKDLKHVLNKIKNLSKTYREEDKRTFILQQKDIDDASSTTNTDNICLYFENYQELMKLLKKLSVYPNIKIIIKTKDQPEYKNIPANYQTIIKKTASIHRISRHSKLKTLQKQSSKFNDFDIIGIDVLKDNQQGRKLFIENLFQKELVYIFISKQEFGILKTIQMLKNQNPRIRIKLFDEKNLFSLIREVQDTESCVIITKNRDQLDQLKKQVRNKLNTKVIFHQSSGNVKTGGHNIFFTQTNHQLEELIESIPKLYESNKKEKKMASIASIASIAQSTQNILHIYYEQEIEEQLKNYLLKLSEKPNESIKIYKLKNIDQIEKMLKSKLNIFYVFLVNKEIAYVINKIKLKNFKCFKVGDNLNQFYKIIETYDSNVSFHKFKFKKLTDDKKNIVDQQQPTKIMQYSNQSKQSTSSRVLIRSKNKNIKKPIQNQSLKLKLNNEYFGNFNNVQNTEKNSIINNNPSFIERLSICRENKKTLGLLIPEENTELKKLLEQQGFKIKIIRYTDSYNLEREIVKNSELKLLIVLNFQCLKESKKFKEKFKQLQFIGYTKDTFKVETNKKDHLLSEVESSAKIIALLKNIGTDGSQRRISSTITNRLNFKSTQKIYIFHKADHLLIKNQLNKRLNDSTVICIEYNNSQKLYKQIKNLNKNDIGIIIEKDQEIFYIQQFFNQPNIKFIRHSAQNNMYYNNNNKRYSILLHTSKEENIFNFLIQKLSSLAFKETQNSEEKIQKSSRTRFGSTLQQQKSLSARKLIPQKSQLKFKSSSKQSLQLPQIKKTEGEKMENIQKVKSQKYITESEYYFKK